jgi:integrase/recombinase XerD
MFVVKRTGPAASDVDFLDETGLSVEIVSRFLRYASARGYSPNTIVAYAYDLVHLWSFLSAKNLGWEQFSAAGAVEFLSYLRALPSRRRGQARGPTLVADRGVSIPPGLSPATVNRNMVAVASFYDWAILIEAFAGENPIRRFEDRTILLVSDRHRPFLDSISRRAPMAMELRVKTVHRLPRPLSEHQIAALLDALRSRRDVVLVKLMLNAGLRPGEVLGLHLSDIAYGRRRIAVRCRDDHPKGARSKSRTERFVDLHDSDTLIALNAYVMTERSTEAQTPFVFLVDGRGARRCEPLSYAGLARLFARACARAGIREPWMTPHALRHTHATRMWEAGMRELTLQRRLGHASPESTRVYTRVSDAVVVAEYRRALGLEADPS